PIESFTTWCQARSRVGYARLSPLAVIPSTYSSSLRNRASAAASILGKLAAWKSTWARPSQSALRLIVGSTSGRRETLALTALRDVVAAELADAMQAPAFAIKMIVR